MRCTDGRLRRLGICGGAGAVMLWLAVIAFQLVKHGFEDGPLSIILFAVIGGVFLFFVVSEWMCSVGSVLRRHLVSLAVARKSRLSHRRQRDSEGWYGADGSWERISGEVVRVDLITPNEPISPTLRLVVGTADGLTTVYVVPGWQATDLRDVVQPGDEVGLAGRSVLHNDERVFIASKVRKSDGRVGALEEGE